MKCHEPSLASYATKSAEPVSGASMTAMPWAALKLVVDAEDQTALSEDEVLPKDEEGFQSEAALEQHLIEILTVQGTAHLQIHSEDKLVANLREAQDYTGVYRVIWDERRKARKAEKNSIVDDFEFDMELKSFYERFCDIAGAPDAVSEIRYSVGDISE